MGYAQLSEGRVEKLDVIDELDRAIAQVFPPRGADRDQNPPRIRRPFPAAADAARPFVGNPGEPAARTRAKRSGRQGNVFVTAQCHRDHSVEISVRDDGPGIPPDKIERIFEAYYTTKEKGTGLGLAIVKHNVELYGGTVRVESKSGKGATFVLLFPAKALMKLSKT